MMTCGSEMAAAVTDSSNYGVQPHADFNCSYGNWHPICIADPEEMLRPSTSNPHFADIMVTHSVTLLLGLTGNLGVVTVMVSERKSRSRTNLFLASLAFADLLLLVIGAPLQTLQYFVVQWDEAGAVCKLSLYAELLSAVASVLNLSAVTIERFVVIVFPMQSRFLCTIRNCRCSVGVVWVLSFALAAPVLFTKETFPVTYTNGIRNVTLYHCNDAANGVPFAAYQLFVLFGAPAVLMVTCYTYVIRELWLSTRSMRALTNSTTGNEVPHNTGQMSTEDSNGRKKRIIGRRCRTPQSGTVPSHPKRTDVARRARKQVIKMLILVVILFLACWGPRIIMELIIKIGLDSFNSAAYTLRVTFNVLPYVHACINPFIYSFMSKNFRCSLERLCCRRQLAKTSRSTVTSSDHSTTQSTFEERHKKKIKTVVFASRSDDGKYTDMQDAIVSISGESATVF